MTRAVADAASGRPKRGSRLDGVGLLQLAGLFAYTGSGMALVGARIVGDVRRETDPTTWLIAVGLGVVLGLAAMILQYWIWRRRGGQRLSRLSRRVWRTGELPEALGARVAVLRDLERRNAELDRQIPVLVLGVLWTINVVLQIAGHHSLADVAGWLLLWGLYAALTVRNVIDRRRWPSLRRLIAELRDNPLHAPS